MTAKGKITAAQTEAILAAIENGGIVPAATHPRTLAALEAKKYIVRATATYGVTLDGYRAVGRDDIADRLEAEWAAMATQEERNRELEIAAIHNHGNMRALELVETPSVFPGEPPVRTYPDGSQEYGPYASIGQTSSGEEVLAAPVGTEDPATGDILIPTRMRAPRPGPEEDPLQRAARLIREGHSLAAQAPEYVVPEDVKAQDAALVAKDRKSLTGAILELGRAAGEALGVAQAPKTPVQVRPRCVPGDVVRIHRGSRLYEVLRVEEEYLVGGEDISQARLAPCDPEDDRMAFWTSMDLLHIVPPVAILRTQEADPAAPRVRYCTEALAVEGPGWSVERGKLRWVALIQTSAVRASTAHLAVFNGPSWHGVQPVATLRIGEAVVVDGRCFQVAWDGGPGEPRLIPAPWRNRVA